MVSEGEVVQNGQHSTHGNGGLVRNKTAPVLFRRKSPSLFFKNADFKINSKSNISHEIIEVECAERSLNVVDCTIRNIKKFDDSGHTFVKPHIELSVQIDTDASDALYKCIVSYFDQRADDQCGDSVGKEEFEFYYQHQTENGLIHFAAPLNFPAEAERVVVQIKADKSLQQWCLAVGILTVACFLLLISLDIEAVVGLFG